MDAEWTGVQPARDPGAGLVEVGDLGPRQLLADPLDESAQPAGGLGHQPTKHASRAAHTQPIIQHLGGPLDRQVVAHQQVARQPTDPRPLPTAALAPLGPILTHPQPHLGQVKDLPGLHPGDRRQRQVPTTATAPLGPMDHDLIRVSHLGKVRTRRTGLLTGRPPTTTPLLPARGRLAKPVRRRWPGGIGGVLAKAPLQLSHPRLERGNQAGLLGVGRCQPGVGLP